ncbi:DUF2911 domain-containing protein [Salinimicrobium flavum]|uniref:DUF2911 domain-containing protein n=1 Tax=Salinimicrobium flavum TaxID=1737065 RepID=A0ABW5IU65_9FLAO
MKQKIILLMIFFGITATTVNGQVEHTNGHASHTMKAKTSKKSLSPHTMTMAMIDGAHVHIDYSAPGVRDRVIFGGLVGFDRVWQAGAHNATWLQTDKDLVFSGKVLPAGKYGFFLIPGKQEWTVIFNFRWDQHGKDEYNETEDVLRLTVKPVDLKEVQEVLTYEVNKTGDKSGEIVFSWEKKKLDLPFTVK